MSDKQSNLTDKEMEDLQNIVTDTLASVCAMADKHNIDRDSMLKYFSDMLTAFTEVASMIPKDAFTHNEYMELCMLLLSKCDYIYLMKGWEESAGANMEYGYAVAADKIILKE